MAFPVGAGVCSLILFFAYLICPSQGKFLSLAASLLLTTALLGYVISRNARDPLSSAEALPPLAHFQKIDLQNKRLLAEILLSLAGLFLFLGALFAVIQFFSLSTPLNVWGGWDARFFWSLKAKFFFRSPADWQGMFSPKLFWSHPDYPLLLPGIQAWGWHWLGRESLIWGPVVSLGFYVSCAFLLVWYLRAYVSSATGWFAGTFFLVLGPYLFWSLQQYADVPLGFFIAASVLTLTAAVRSGQVRLFCVSGLLGGLAAWTKNEGLFFLAEAAVFLGIYCAFRGRRKARDWKPLAWFAGGVVLPLLAIVILKVFLGTTGEYLGPKRALHDYFRLLFGGWDRTSLIFQAFFVHMTSFTSWKGTWIIFAAGALLRSLKKITGADRCAWIVFGAVLFINLGYFLTLHLTPYDLKFQIQTAFARLLLHSGILAVAFGFEALTLILPKSKGQTTS